MPSRASSPAAFLSYVREDDKYGHISELRQRIEDEVRIQTGEPFPIFQDRNDILWGQNWQTRIEDALDGATLLIPVLTPAFFKSPACRKELERFVERESKLGRGDLVLPIYYVDTPLLNEGSKKTRDPVASLLRTRQYFDWRSLRFEPYTSPEIGKVLAGLAQQIRAAVSHLESSPSVGKRRTLTTRRPRSPKAVSRSTADSGADGGEKTGAPSVQVEPPTIVVDLLHRGDYPTITAAVQAAVPGSRILLRPGVYEEGILLDKPLEIIGDGNLDEISIQNAHGPAVLFRTTMGRISNLSLRYTGNEKQYAVEIAQGRLELEGCDVSSAGMVACVGIHGAAIPLLRRNRIHTSNSAGVVIYENGHGTLEDNDIWGHAGSGVNVQGSANPTLRRNRIYTCKHYGVFFHEDARGILEDNEIFGHAFSGVAIKGPANPAIRRNRIHSCAQMGVTVYQRGQGTIETNEIIKNRRAGVSAWEGGMPVVRANQIHENTHAVWIFSGGGGEFVDNDLTNNTSGPWDIERDSLAGVKRERNIE